MMQLKNLPNPNVASELEHKSALVEICQKIRLNAISGEFSEISLDLAIV